uniref:Merozoite surface protein 7 n=1 Tax=Meloidogyne hapla TaxID=6305 RepID=A0A1I8B636_MELHA
MVDAGQNPNVLNCFTGKNSPKHKTPKYEQNHNKNGINNDQKNIVHSNSYQKNVETSPIHEKIPEIIIGKVAKLENDESSNSSSSTSSSTNSAKSVDSITSSFSSLSSSSSSSKHSKGKNLAMVQEETGIDPEGIEETEHQNQGNKIAKYIENIFIKLFEELAKLTKQINYSHGNRKYNLKKEELKNFIKNIYSNIDQAKNPSEMLYKSNK